MGKPFCTDDEFIRLWHTCNSPKEMAKILGVAERNIYKRRNRIQDRHGIALTTVDESRPTPISVTLPANGVRVGVEITDGVVVVGSDAHYWPGIVSTAHRALVHIIDKIKPVMFILNGDGFDGAQASRHPRIGWEGRPNIKQELDAVKDRLAEIEAVIGNGKLHWTWGNHDIRFNGRLSANVPEFEGICGFSLADHFPRWKFSTSVMVNGHTMVKHRWHNGVHCSYQNTLKAGTSIVCGHTHSLKVTPWNDYQPNTRYGVDTGTLAAPDGPQFNYSEDAPANHRSGFAVLTFMRGILLPPELVQVINEDDGLIFFRGVVMQV